MYVVVQGSNDNEFSMYTEQYYIHIQSFIIYIVTVVWCGGGGGERSHTLRKFEVD